MNLDPSIQKYFSFSFTYKGQIYYGYYTVAVFGLNTLSQVFTKLMKPLVKRGWDAGLHILLFLDDGLGPANWRKKLSTYPTWSDET